jgi:hypothetical protein
MKLAVFGCSWSQGVPSIDNNVCWPKMLADKCTDWEVDNFSLAGSSLSFQAYLLDDVLKHNLYDKIVFQLTSPSRLTYFDDNVNYGKYLQQNKNYRDLDRTGNIYRNIICITPGHLKLSSNDSFWNYPDKFDFANLYYKYSNKQINKLEYQAVVEYVSKKVDLIYFHNQDILELGKYPILNNEVRNHGGQELLNSFIADHGEHYNTAGCMWQAEWILNKL